MRYIARREAESMKGTGEVAHLCRHCGASDASKKQCHGKVQPHVMVYMATPLYRSIHQTPCSITVREMEVNVGGLGEVSEQKSVAAKIRVWMHVKPHMTVQDWAGVCAST